MQQKGIYTLLPKPVLEISSRVHLFSKQRAISLSDISQNISIAASTLYEALQCFDYTVVELYCDSSVLLSNCNRSSNVENWMPILVSMNYLVSNPDTGFDVKRYYFLIFLFVPISVQNSSQSIHFLIMVILPESTKV